MHSTALGRSLWKLLLSSKYITSGQGQLPAAGARASSTHHRRLHHGTCTCTCTCIRTIGGPTMAMYREMERLARLVVNGTLSWTVVRSTPSAATNHKPRRAERRVYLVRGRCGVGAG